MQRLLTLVFLLCLTLPAGMTLTGCFRNPQAAYCNGEGFGLKLTQVASIDLEPRTTGISLAYGQTQQLATPTAKTCKGATASVSAYIYGTSNNQLLDISPSGNLCAGTWNRRTGGGIPDFTICNYPTPAPTTNGLPYQTATVTATAESVTSNTVQVWVHAQVTSVSLVLEKLNTTSSITGCLSQTQTAQLDSQAYYSLNGTQTLLCAPNSTTVPSCSSAIGNLTYASQNPTVATIDEYGVITAQQPGTTYITASVAGSGSSAGNFSTCPPASINITLNGQTTGTVTQGVTQNLVTTVRDINGNTLTGLALDYQSTNPLNISAGAGGAVTANYAGQSSIYAVCQPTTCNSAPIDVIGLNQTGTPITSNEVKITTPGIASTFIWLASPQSEYFVPVELLTGTLGSTVKLPYFPNSMVMDRDGNTLYFGSTHELMEYSTTTNALIKEDPSVQGVVLAVSPDNQQVLISDPIRKLFYLYKASGGSSTTFSGVGNSAYWTPDAKTLYVVGTDYTNNLAGTPTLFVNNVNTGWTTYPLNQTTPAESLAITVPSVGAFLSGYPTVAHAWCPNLTPSPGYPQGQAYPQAASLSVETDQLAATNDGTHIIGIGLNGGTTPTLTDINVNLFASLVTGACPASENGIIIATPFKQTPLPFQASSITQIVPSPATNLSFITYDAASGAGGAASLPYYQPTANGSLGTIGSVPLVGAATAPVAGVFSLDDTLFFVSTSGDNAVHYIDTTKLQDTKQITPSLVDANGNVVPATLLAVKPRPTT
uniref:BIG2 domain-containing protein n=1 Tax=mine drainage metagenome TaxID=410659 RepID=E6QHP2_9ZZZZ